eukprot:3689461-Rhodomonas_salina.1
MCLSQPTRVLACLDHSMRFRVRLTFSTVRSDHPRYHANVWGHTRASTNLVRIVCTRAGRRRGTSAIGAGFSANLESLRDGRESQVQNGQISGPRPQISCQRAKSRAKAPHKSDRGCAARIPGAPCTIALCSTETMP